MVNYERERAFYVKQRYLTDMIVPSMIERGDSEALFLVKDEIQKWSEGIEYVTGDTVTWNGNPITCIISHNTFKHPDWNPTVRPEYWYHWKRGIEK